MKFFSCIEKFKKFFLEFNLLALFIFVGPLNVYAATYYVNYQNGSDKNNGLTPSTSWQHCPGDKNATDNVANIKPKPGDTFLFRGGVVYQGEIELKWSGVEGKPITYNGEDWGNGRAIIDGSNNQNASGFRNKRGAGNYTIIKGFEIREMGGFAPNNEPSGSCASPINSAPSGSGISLDSAHSVEIARCYIHEIGNWLNRQPFTADSLTGVGISLQDTKNITITDVDLTRMHTGISIKPKYGEIDNIEIKNCNLHDYLVWGIDIGVRGPNLTVKNISIHDNYLANMNYYDHCEGGWAGCGEKPHSDYIFVRNDYDDSYFKNLQIFNNTFKVTNGQCQAGTAMIYLSNGTSALIYNNEFIGVSASLGIIAIDYDRPKKGRQEVEILNNSFYGPGRCIFIRKKDPTGRFIVKNNIFYRTKPYLLVTLYDKDITTGTIEFDYNLYFRDDGSPSLFYYNGSYGLSLLYMRTQGYETHALHADPKFRNPSEDLELQTTSPCLDSGNNFSKYFSIDKKGNLRPKQGHWDIGAFQLSAINNSTKTPPSVPFNLIINPK